MAPPGGSSIGCHVSPAREEFSSLDASRSDANQGKHIFHADALSEKTFGNHYSNLAEKKQKSIFHGNPI
jgi:hypothetical protein